MIARVKKRPDRLLKKLNRIEKQLGKGGRVKVGLPANSADYPDGTSVLMVGIVHEFGAPEVGIPERSYLRAGLSKRRRHYKSFTQKLLKRVSNGTISSDKAMEILGLKAASDIKAEITALDTPPLVYREGNPLVDTGHLRRSITHVVENDK